MGDTVVVDVGFTETRVPPGTHVCQIYGDDSERLDVLLRFVTRGLGNGEATACFPDEVDEPVMREWLAREGLSLDALTASGLLTLNRCRDVYFEGGRFDPARMLDLVKSFHETSVTKGCPAARVIGEMSPEVTRIPGGAQLIDYERQVNHLLREHPVTALCQYRADAFDGATIMDLLSVHPVMVVRGSLVQNPFYVPPEELAGR